MAPEPIIVSSSATISFIATTPPSYRYSAPISSSPSLPSPSQIMRKKKDVALITGTSTSTVPDEALRGFKSASNLLRESYEIGERVSFSLNKDPDTSGLEKDRGVVQKSSIRNDGDNLKTTTAKVAKKPPAPQRKRPKKSEIETAPCQDSPVIIQTGKGSSLKKPRATKTRVVGQTQITNGKIIKSIQRETTTKDCQSRKDLNDGSKLLDEDAKVSTYEGGISLGLDKAVARRRDWTPIKSLSHIPDELYGGAIVEPALQDTEFSPSNHVKGRDLGEQQPIRTANGGGITKKRKLDLIESLIPPKLPKISSKSSKSHTKKAQTVTAKATEQYVVQNTSENSPMLQYLSSSQLQHECIGDQPETALELQSAKPIRRRSEAKTASKKSTANKKPGKTRIQKSTLLSPEEALQATKEQDLLFGTSSQLVQEESPTFVREIQQAIKASETQQKTNTVADSFDNGTSSNSLNTYGVSLLSSSRNLWSVAARDDDGRLLKTEVIDLVDTPKPRSLQNIDIEDDLILDAPLDLEDTDRQQVWDSTDHLDIPKAILKSRNIPWAETEDQVAAHQSIPKSVAEAALRQRPKSRSPTKKPVALTSNGVSIAAIEAMPDFQGYTTAKLSKAIASYGFKPVKNRDTMIGLLEKCWEGKARLALQSLPTNLSLPQSIETGVAGEKSSSPVKRRGRPPKVKDPPAITEDGTTTHKPTTKPRGRPKKAVVPSTANSNVPLEKQSAAATQSPPPKPRTPVKSAFKTPKISMPLEVIEDPAPPTTPSPPRRRSPPSKVLPLPLSTIFILPDTSNTPSASSPTTRKTYLQTKITEAIQSFPPTHDVKNLTWNEKILMYDPIVLEDLAAWLNTVGLGRVGVDEEVHALEVRSWCEANSVCCLWKENLRGGKRGRY